MFVVLIEDDFDVLICVLISVIGVQGMQDMGKVMNDLCLQVFGCVDMGYLSKKVKVVLVQFGVRVYQFR